MPKRLPSGLGKAFDLGLKPVLPCTRRSQRYKGVARPSNRYQTRRLVSDGCQSGRLGTPGKRVYRKVPRGRIPPHPPQLSSSYSSTGKILSVVRIAAKPPFLHCLSPTTAGLLPVLAAGG